MERRIYPLETHKIMGRLLDRHYAEAKRAKEEGKKIVWCIGQVDVSILVAMDYIPVYPENHATLCGARGFRTELCMVAEAHDFSPDLCSYARNDLGTIFSKGEKSPIGGLPKPDLLYTATMCNTHLKWWEELNRIFDVPLLVLDTPYVHDGLNPEDISAIISYIRRQLEEHINVLEGITGKPFNYDRFQEAVDFTNKAGMLYGEIVNMARHIPSPITSFDTFLHLAPLMIWRGFPEAASYYEELKKEVEGRIKQGFSAIGEEKYRLYWDNIPI